MRLPPRAALRGEQPYRHGRAGDRRVRIVCEPGGPRGDEQQLGLAGGLSADAVEQPDRRIRVCERLPGEARAHQHLAAADGEHERRRGQLGVHLLGLVEELERHGDVARPERGQAPALHRVRLVVLLAGGLPQPLGRREVGVGPVHRAEREMHGRAQGERPRRPDHVIDLPQHGNCPPHVVQRLRVSAQHPPGVGPQEQDARPALSTAARDAPLEGLQALPGAPRVHQRHAQGAQDVRLTLRRVRAGRQVTGPPQMVQGEPDVAEVPLPDADHMVRHGGLERRRIAVEDLPRTGQRLARRREHHRQQFENRVASRSHSAHPSGPRCRPHRFGAVSSSGPAALIDDRRRSGRNTPWRHSDSTSSSTRSSARCPTSPWRWGRTTPPSSSTRRASCSPATARRPASSRTPSARTSPRSPASARTPSAARAPRPTAPASPASRSATRASATGAATMPWPTPCAPCANRRAAPDAG